MGGRKEFELTIEIGHKSAPLTKKLPNGYTHKWTAYIKGINSAKIEHCVQRVVFQLHESFPDPYRDVSEPPFRIKETGYAGFEIPIQIYFKNRDKPNHVVFVHDLCLLTNKPNDNSTFEKIKFINPNKDFEKCLIKSGAQLIEVPRKKEKSHSPPAKRHKSLSLIPSKDMSKQPQTSQQPQAQTNHHSRQHSASDTSVKQFTNDGNNQQNKSKKFIDVFGPPLVFGGKTKQEQKGSDLSMIKAKISRLDCDRLQKIVDIVEEAGARFTVTSKKFEFDLECLDRKTLGRIEALL